MYGPISAFESYLFNALTLNARATRSEYWWPALIVGLAMIAAGVADAMTVMRVSEAGGLPPLNPFSYWTPLLSLLTLVPNITCGIRRLHDTGRSGFWVLVMLVPMVGGLIYILLLSLPSEPRENAWGQPRGQVRPHARDDAEPGAPTSARRTRGHRPSALDSYAVLLQAEAEPSPEEIARRKQEVHEYFKRNVSRRASA
ncbi:DUF805 domain-containing protein [Salipiger abyssi]|uniref:DUF805 domain-containing protein n=1 Tax=Salipiger abyssi TaxID=1250539 RepID=UPI004059F75E